MELPRFHAASGDPPPWESGLGDGAASGLEEGSSGLGDGAASALDDGASALGDGASALEEGVSTGAEGCSSEELGAGAASELLVTSGWAELESALLG